jgi:hypothetical protein
VRRRLAALVLAVAASSACTTPAARPAGTPLRGDVRFAPIVPDEADRAAADAANGALVGDVERVARATARIATFDAWRSEGPTGLEPAAIDLLNATARPGRGYDRASLALLERSDLDPALRERIERAVESDPLWIASARVRDARVTAFARLFNTIVEPIGQSLLVTALAPYRLAQATLRYGLDLYRQDPLPLQRRQALAHWKDFLSRYPDDPEHTRVSLQVARAQVKWNETERLEALEEAERALDAERPREALVRAERALGHAPEAGDDEAERLLAEAAALLQRQRAERSASVRFGLPEGAPLIPPGTRTQSLALLAGEPDLDVAARGDALASTASELRFVRASALVQRNPEAGFDALREIADTDPATDNMARHARALLADPVRNPYDTFVSARWRDRRARAGWVLLGPFKSSEIRFSPAGLVAGVLALPALVQTTAALPLRLLQFPWMAPPATAKVTAVQARRVLALHPDPARADEVSDWLESYERDRRNYVGALRVAETRPDSDPDELAELREQAARQALRVALKEERADMRRALLMGVTRKFPNTEAGDEAGREVRREIEEHTPHEIALTRGFLEENPEVAGVRGLALDPELLDEDNRDGELHPDGVALLGGRVIEIRSIAESGDEDDEPVRSHVVVSEERLAQIVARLEETSFRNSLLDDEDPVVPDAGRDMLFERARLGLADDLDRRSTAEANFAYRGMRERYGVVRRRKPILPFDLVVRGSLADLSLGAFPRLREPEPTPDAVLYE